MWPAVGNGKQHQIYVKFVRRIDLQESVGDDVHAVSCLLQAFNTVVKRALRQKNFD